MSDVIELNRELYKAIKKMKKDDMQKFLSNIYMQGKNDHEVGLINYEELKADLAQIKGIGEGRLNEIMSVIDKHMNGTENND